MPGFVLLVLLAGHSKAGKSRTAFEAALRLYPQQPLLIPTNGKALAEIFRLDPPLKWSSDPLIVWLDDLQRFLGPEGLSLSLLNSLSLGKGRVKLLATLTSTRYESYMSPAGDVEKDIQLILRRFRQVRLPSELNDVETQRARALYPQEPREKLAEGLGEHFVAAHELIRRYDTGKEGCPQGYVLVRVAIDWRRAGLLRPIPESTLKRLASQYLRFLKIPHIDLTPEAYTEGLQWARKPIGIHISLLAGAGGEGPEKSFEAFDYIIDHTDRQGASIPDEAWKAILQFVSPSEAILMAFSAYQRQNKSFTEQALAHAIEVGAPDDKSHALHILGNLCQEDGRFQEAERAHRQAIGSLQADVSSSAMTQLGRLLLNRGELAEAEQHLQRAFDLQHPDTLLNATLALGSLFLAKGEWDKAERLYQGLDASTDPSGAAIARVNLGRLHELRGDRDQAERLYHQAIGSKQPEAVPLAMNNLGGILMERGELEQAERLFREASTSAHPEAAAISKVNLGAIFLKRGDLSRAEQLYRVGLASKQPFAVALATVHLGLLFQKRGEQAEARRLFQQALDSKHPDVVPFAAFNLSSLLLNLKRHSEVEPLFQLVVHSQVPELKEPAALLLGISLFKQKKIALAEATFRGLLDCKDKTISLASYGALGMISKHRKDLAGAEPYFRKAITCPEGPISTAASLELGKLLLRKGEVSEATHLLQNAAGSSDKDIARQARRVLAMIADGHEALPACSQPE